MHLIYKNILRADYTAARIFTCLVVAYIMVPDTPYWVPALFVLTLFLTVWIFLQANFQRRILWFLILWAIIQSVLSLAGFYNDTSIVPPRLLLVFVPVLLTIGWLFLSKGGKAILNRYDLRLLTMIHAVRLPVEIVLYGLFMAGAVPELMTFTGQNPDIIMGITAPLVYWLCFRLWADQPERSRRFLIIWNIAGILLLVNIVTRAVLSIPTPIQQFGFEQPNVAVIFFPYVLLPAVIVPIVMVSHLASLRLLLRR